MKVGACRNIPLTDLLHFIASQGNWRQWPPVIPVLKEILVAICSLLNVYTCLYTTSAEIITVTQRSTGTEHILSIIYSHLQAQRPPVFAVVRNILALCRLTDNVNLDLDIAFVLFPTRSWSVTIRLGCIIECAIIISELEYVMMTWISLAGEMSGMFSWRICRRKEACNFQLQFPVSQKELKNNFSVRADFRVDEKLFNIKSFQTLSSLCGPSGCCAAHVTMLLEQ